MSPPRARIATNVPRRAVQGSRVKRGGTIRHQAIHVVAMDRD
jgi:hypothetical protein